jgi:hypothetical protein
LPIGDHPSFDRPPVTTRLWRYSDLAKFFDLLTSGQLWLTNAEVLATDDPYDGLPGAVRFPHRVWRSIDEVPEQLRVQILETYNRDTEGDPEAAFKSWFMVEEQRCVMEQSSRRDYFVSCWHAAEHESAAMWKIYASPGAGVAIISNGARLETALGSNEESFYLGAIKYRDPAVVEIGANNAFDSLMIKRSSFEYEREVRLVHWRTDEYHDALANFAWNEDRMRFDDLIEDPRPLTPGMSVDCDVDALIEKVPLTEEEQKAAAALGDVVFGNPNAGRRLPDEDPLAIYDFFLEAYASTPREKLLEFLAKHLRFDEFKSLPAEDLRTRVCREWTKSVLADREARTSKTDAAAAA